MITKEQTIDLLGILATASITAVGFAIGGSIGPAVIGPAVVGAIGVNLSSTLIQNGGVVLKERWLSSDNGILNQDIQRALARAFIRALKYVETAYFERGQANALPKDAQASIKALFRELKDQAQGIFLKSFDEVVAEQKARERRLQLFFKRTSAQPQDPSLRPPEKLTVQQELEKYLYGTPEEAKETLWQRIDEKGFLSTYDEDFRDFFRKNLLNTINLCFAEELNTDNKESNRAWRAFQRLLLEGIRTDVQSIQASQGVIQETLKKLDTVQSQLQQLQNVVDSRTPDEPFQTEMEQVLREMWAEMQDLAQSIQRTEQQMAEAAALLNQLVVLAEGHFIKEGEVVRYYRRQHDVDLLNELYGEGYFVGREQDIKKLTDFMPLGGYWLVTAPAGSGKSTLMAYWLRSLAQQNGICYHFFNTQRHINDFTSFMACLCEQLLHVHGINGQVRESEPTLLRSMITVTLLMAHTSSLVVIIDGLDEARDPAYPNQFAFPKGFFPKKLGEGIMVIFTVRTTDGVATAEQLSRQLNLTLEHFPLPELSVTAVQDLLKQSGNELLRAKANDLDFAKRLREKTGGLAIYLRYLVEELADSTDERDWDQTIIGLPEGFKQFVMQAVQAVNGYPAWRDALRYLALAKGRMSNRDLLSLTDLSHNPLQPEDLVAVPWSVQRWLSRQERGWSFQHTSIAEAYAEGYMRDKLDKQFLQHLFDYCAVWRQHKSLYALQYYALHLQDEERFDELFALARDDAFQQEQKRTFPEDPDLSLTTVELALVAAAKMDSTREMAEFILTYLRRKVAITQESPVDALQGKHAEPPLSTSPFPSKVEQAGALADLYGIELSALWHFLLVWELKDAGRNEEMQLALKRLLAKEGTVRLSLWKGDCAAVILSHLFEQEDPTPLIQGKMLLDHDAQRSLCEQLSTYRHFALASQLAGEIGDGQLRVEALCEITVEQAKVGEWEDANNTFTKVLRVLDEIEDPQSQVTALATFALFQTQLEKKEVVQVILSESLAALEMIKESDQKATVHATLAGACIQMHETQAARKNIVIALRMARKVEDPERRFALMKSIAYQLRRGERGTWRDVDMWTSPRTAQEFEQGSRDVAREVIAEVKAKTGQLTSALRLAHKIELLLDRVQALVTIADTWRQDNGQERAATILAEAFDDALKIKDELEQEFALEILTKVYAVWGKFEDALKTAQRMEEGWGQSNALQIIAEAYAQVGDVTNAMHIAEKIEQGEYQAQALIMIGKAQVKHGTMQVARRTFAQALQTAQIANWQPSYAQALGMIASSLATTKDFERAFQIARSIPRKPHRAHALQAIAQMQANVKDYEAARKTAQEIDPEFKELVQGVLEAIASNQAQAKEFEAVAITLQAIEDVGHRSHVMEKISLAYASGGEYSDALRIAKGIEDLFVRANTLGTIAIMQSQSGANQDAQATFAETFHVIQDIEDLFTRANAQRLLAEAYAVIGDFDSAFQIGWSIKANFIQQKALVVIASTQVEQAQFEAAVQTSIKLLKMGYLPLGDGSLYDSYSGTLPIDMLVYLGVNALIAQVQQAEDVQASLTATEADQTLKELFKKPVNAVKVFSCNARVLAFLEYEKDAEDSFATALQTAKEIEDIGERAAAFSTIAKAQIRAGFGREAIQTTALIEAKRADYLVEIAAELLKANDIENFKRLLVPCANYPETAYKMCGFLSQAYPEQSMAIAEAIREGNG